MLPHVYVIDASNGRTLPIEATFQRASSAAGTIRISADGSRLGYTVFHGTFASNRVPATVRLSRLSADDVRGLDRVNAFRASFGLAPLTADENLTEAARYWSREERIAGRVGHTCAALGHPAGCVEFNTYYHRLPGVPATSLAGQNAAFDTLATWLAPEALFEAERNGNGERGHFLNLIDARRWIGLGVASIPGYGAYFAMNLI